MPMKSSTKVLLVLGGAGAAAGGLAWYLADPAVGGGPGAGGGAGGGVGRVSHGIMPWLFRGWSSGGPGRPVGTMGGITHGGFGTTAHAVSG